MRHILRFIAVVATLAIAACSSVDCPVQNTVETVYHAYKAGGERDTLADTLTILTVRKDRTDSTLLNRNVKTSEFRLPISYTAPEDTLIFKFSKIGTALSTPYDTVVVSKTNEPQFESIDCHIAFFHTITKVRWTDNNIDSIVVNQASVNYDASKAHFHIYFKSH